MSRLRVAWKRWLARHRLVMEFCHRCGRDVRQVWRTSDTLWAGVVEGRWDILCIDCFDELAGSEVVLRWTPRLDG